MKLFSKKKSSSLSLSPARKEYLTNIKKENIKIRFTQIAIFLTFIFIWEIFANYKIIDKKSMLTEINDRGEAVSKQKQEELISLIKEISGDFPIAVMSGSLPKGVEPEFYGRAVEAIPKNVKVIVDTEKMNMLSVLGKREVFMVKPNLRELESFTGDVVRDLYDMVRASRKYLNKGAKYVLVSLGSEGAVLTDGTESYFCKSASVAVNSTVGAGDSMVAAACVGIQNGVSMAEILRMATAAGTAAVTTSGTNLFYREKYQEIYVKVFSEKIT